MKGEKKKLFSKRNLVSLFIIFIMVSSVIGFMAGRSGVQKKKYGEYSFTRKGNEWVVDIDNKEFAFDYFPIEVQDINIGPEIINRVSNTLEIDSTYDEDDAYSEGIVLAQYRLGPNLDKLGIFLRMGLINENEYNLPVIVCEDATVQVPILYFRKSNQTRVYLDGDCVIAEARNEIDFIRIKDRLLYGLLGII